MTRYQALKISLSKEEKQLINSILEKIRKEDKKKNKKALLISSREFAKLLNQKERVLIQKILQIDPRQYGFEGRYLGVQTIPKDLVAIRHQKYKLKDKTKTIKTQYLPRHTYLAYKKLNSVLVRDTGRKLLIESGYRSSAYQLITFLWYLRFYKFSFFKTIKRVALPGYSEHCLSRMPAIDFITLNGIPTEEKLLAFAKTKEYQWLLKNAEKFCFYQSYSKNNKAGIIYEPWHWQFRKKAL